MQLCCMLEKRGLAGNKCVYGISHPCSSLLNDTRQFILVEVNGHHISRIKEPYESDWVTIWRQNYLHNVAVLPVGEKSAMIQRDHELFWFWSTETEKVNRCRQEKTKHSLAVGSTIVIFLGGQITKNELLHGLSRNAIQTQAPDPHAPDHLPHLKGWQKLSRKTLQVPSVYDR
jgi:hypothetical protein